MMVLRIEFSGQDDPVGREVERLSESGIKILAGVIDAGRREGSIPPGPPAEAVALALIGAIEGVAIALAGKSPQDEALAARTAAGVLGLDGLPTSGDRK
jgi:hypothetical protein